MDLSGEYMGLQVGNMIGLVYWIGNGQSGRYFLISGQSLYFSGGLFMACFQSQAS